MPLCDVPENIPSHRGFLLLAPPLIPQILLESSVLMHTRCILQKKVWYLRTLSHSVRISNIPLGWIKDIVHLQKISILPPQKVLEFPWGVGGSVRPKNLRKCVKLYWNFQRGGGGLRKNPFHGGGYGYFLELYICAKMFQSLDFFLNF